MKSFKFVLIAACAAAIGLNAEVLTKTTDISLGGKKVGKIEVLRRSSFLKFHRPSFAAHLLGQSFPVPQLAAFGSLNLLPFF